MPRRAACRREEVINLNSDVQGLPSLLNPDTSLSCLRSRSEHPRRSVSMVLNMDVYATILDITMPSPPTPQKLYVGVGLVLGLDVNHFL